MKSETASRMSFSPPAGKRSWTTRWYSRTDSTLASHHVRWRRAVWVTLVDSSLIWVEMD